MIVVKLVDVFHKYMYVSHFTMKQFAAIEIQKDTGVEQRVKYAVLCGIRKM